MKHSEGGVTFLVEHGELDGSILECAHSCAPTIVRASACVGFRLLEADGEIFDVGDLRTIDGEDGLETKSYFWRICISCSIVGGKALRS